jgi:hypothetical protein
VDCLKSYMVPQSLKCNIVALMDRKFILLLLIKMNHNGHMVVQYVEIFCVFYCFLQRTGST